MKRKILIIVIGAIIVNLYGCINNTKSDKVLDSIILDDNTKEEINKEINIELISKTEEIALPQNNYGIAAKENLILYTLVRDEENKINSQFSDWYLESLKVGEITRGKENDFNKINWESKEVEGLVLQDFNNSNEVRIIKDNKGYKFNEKGDLEEIEIYNKFLEKNINSIGNLESYVNGTIDCFFINEDKYEILDVLNNKLYEIDNSILEGIEDRRLVILGIDNNKIFVSFESIETSIYKRESSSIIGYIDIENNKFNKILSSDIGINLNILGDVIYLNNKILFSGYVDGKNGIWNYDINNNKLNKEIDLNEGTSCKFNISPNKDKIIISSYYYDVDGNNTYNLNIANINENLEISNFTNISLANEKSEIKAFGGWINNGEEFYLSKSLSSLKNGISISYELYKVIEK